MLYKYTAYVFDEIRIIFKPLMIAIFRICLLPKMRLPVDLEGRFTGYKCQIISDGFFSWLNFSLKGNEKKNSFV